MGFRRVGVLLGGLSAEREVSLASGRAIARGLREAGYDTVEIDVDRDLPRRLTEAGIEAAFIALHGRLGEDGTIQGLLELLGIPYTGSSVLASAVAMDKPLAREILAARGLPVAEGFVIERGDTVDLPAAFPRPIVVKPADEGSSVGITIVRDDAEFDKAVAAALATSDRILVEQFVEGAEIQVAVLDGQLLGAVEIETDREFYDYAAKYDAGGSVHHIPPRLDAHRLAAANDIGLRAALALGCTGAPRVDLIVPPAGEIVVLEVNTIPGMTETSLLPEIAAHAGISFPELVSRIVEGSLLHVRV